MTRLYDLTADYARLLEAAEEGADVADLLAALEGSLEAKGAGIVHVLANLEADAAAFAAEEKRLAARRKAAEANADRLREHVRACMLQAGITKLKGGTFSITLSAGPDKVDVADVAALPPEFVRSKVTIEADKRALLAAYKEHGELPAGCEIVPTTRLVIR